MAQLLTGTLVENKIWHPGLFSLRIQTTPFDFVAGQFVRIGLPDSNRKDLRAYSLVNAPDTDLLEFVITRVPGGQLSPQLHELAPGDEVVVSQPPGGFFMLSEVPDGDTLWLMATGTGIGPYLSMLKTSVPWQRFRQIVLVHAVRQPEDLCYQPDLMAWQKQFGEQFRYVPVVSRAAYPDGLQGRIPQLIANGQLERFARSRLNSEAQVMLCGNPAMIKDTMAVLQERDLHRNLRRRPGNITVELYWQE